MKITPCGLTEYSTAEQAPVTVLRTTQGEKAEGRTLDKRI